MIPSFNEYDKKFDAIVVVGYNRINSISRLLNSLKKALYNSQVPLIISIDNSNCLELYKFVRDFSWPHGNKYVIIHETRLGLKNHIYFCGDLSAYFRSITILEDDIYVSPNFYTYINQTVEKYGKDKNVAGISLYKNEYNGFNDLPLTFLKNGYDVFAYQSTSTWGETFTYDMWKEFRIWLSTFNDDFTNIDMYNKIKGWNKAWSKYYEAYIINTNKYFIYPYTSFTTNFNEPGTHVTINTINNSYQVELEYGERILKLPDFNKLPKYDTYAQYIPLKDLFNDKNVGIDLYGIRENINKYQYLLSTRELPCKIIKSFGIRLRPIELNVLENIEGNGIYLYDLKESTKENTFISMDRYFLEYYLKSFSVKLLKLKFKLMIYDKIKRIFNF